MCLEAELGLLKLNTLRTRSHSWTQKLRVPLRHKSNPHFHSICEHRFLTHFLLLIALLVALPASVVYSKRSEFAGLNLDFHSV